MALAAAVTTLLLFSVPGLALEPLLLPVSHQWHSKYDGEVKTDRPLIGILSQPCSLCPGRSYVASSYTRWIQAAGARAVPIRYYASDAELRRLFNSVNGLIFPGGLTWLWRHSPYVIAARKLYDMAIEANDAGDPFPIHGSCLGHQLLQILASNVSRDDLLIRTNSVSHPTTLQLTPAAAHSEYFGRLDADLVAKVGTDNITIQNHEYGVPPLHYERWPILNDTYEVLSTTQDRNGSTYISTIQSRRHPFFGTQWHPEKPSNEFSDRSIPHSLDAIRVAQSLANSFIEVARRSSHTPESEEEELAMVIDSYPLTFTARFEVPEQSQSYDGPDSTYYLDQDERDDPFPSGPFPSDGGKAENASLAEYKAAYNIHRNGLSSRF